MSYQITRLVFNLSFDFPEIFIFLSLMFFGRIRIKKKISLWGDCQIFPRMWKFI
jgi:hypothetical protein